MKNILFAATALTAIIAQPALAQQSRAGRAVPAVNSDEANPASVADIVVTAQKREQKLQQVPISIEVVSSKKLESFNVTDFRRMVQYVPNVSVVNSPGNDAIYIRGFGSNPGNYSFDPSVALYLDGIYAGKPKQSQGPFFDLERVEVLRGPQGALFGKNTAAGAISIVSAGPTSTFHAFVKGLYNFDLKGPELEGYISGPLTDTLGARLAVKYLDQKGYITNRFSGRREPALRNYLARLTVRFAPTAAVNYTVKAEYGDLTVRGGNNVSQSLFETQRPVTSRYTVTPDPFGGTEGTKTKSLIVSGTGNLSIGDHTLTSITGYSWYKAVMVNEYDLTIPDTTAITNALFNTFPDRFHQFSQEIRLASPTGNKFEYLVGAYYDQSYYTVAELDAFDITPLPFPPFLGGYNGKDRSDYTQHTSSYSAFGQATYRFTDQFRAIGSLRYTKTKKDAVYSAVLLSGPFPLQPLTTAKGRINEGSVDPSITLQYNLAPQVMVYATYARGSKSGGFVSNTFGTTDATFAFRPEKSTNYEAGIKSTLAGGHVVLNLSVFDTKFKDLQVSTFNGNTNMFETSNAASADSKGIEGLAAFYPAHNLDITTSFAYQDPKYKDFPGGACLATETVAQCDPLNPASRAKNNIGGSRLPFTSRFSYSVQAHHRLETSKDTALDTTVSVTGRSNYFSSTDLSPLYGRQQAFAKIDARLQYGAIDDRWHVAVVGKNLTNQKTVSSTYEFPFPITNVPRAMLHIDETRNIAVEAALKF